MEPPHYRGAIWVIACHTAVSRSHRMSLGSLGVLRVGAKSLGRGPLRACPAVRLSTREASPALVGLWDGQLVSAQPSSASLGMLLCPTSGVQTIAGHDVLTFCPRSRGMGGTRI